MRITYPDYIKLLRAAFEKKRVNNDLSLLLAQSAPAKIRQACLHLYRRYYDKGELQTLRRDTQALNDFFGHAEHGRQFIEVIEGFETDKFRPLDKYLKGNIENTDERNVELLAWLIEFEHRPYVYDKNFQLSEDEIAIVNAAGGEVREEPDLHLPEKSVTDKKMEQPDAGMIAASGVKTPAEIEKGSPAESSDFPGKGKRKLKLKRAIIILLIVVISAGGIYGVWWNRQRSAHSVCVYWEGDKYLQVPCTEERKGQLVISMDAGKAGRFRRINRLDTMTEWVIGRLYYVRDSNDIKCYNEDGKYPEDMKRSLKLITSRIYQNYILPKKVANSDSLNAKK